MINGPDEVLIGLVVSTGIMAVILVLIDYGIRCWVDKNYGPLHSHAEVLFNLVSGMFIWFSMILYTIVFYIEMVAQ